MANDKGYIEAARAHLQAHGETRGKTLAAVVGIPMSGLYSALKGPIEREEILKRKEGRAVFFRLPGQEAAGVDEKPEVDEPREVRWAHWDDGDIVIYGLVENEDGSHTIPAAVLEAIKRRIAWSPAQ